VSAANPRTVVVLRSGGAVDAAGWIDRVPALLQAWYGGEARAISTRSQVRSGKLVEAVSLVAFESGGVGVMAASLQAGGWLERVTLHGEGLSIQVDAFREMRVLRGNVDEVTGRETAAQWISSLEVRGFNQLIEHFVECVQKRQTPITSALESFKTQMLLEDMVAQAVDKAGLRAVLAEGIIDAGDIERGEKTLKNSMRIAEKFNGYADDRVSIRLGPHALYSCSPRLLRDVREIAPKLKVGVHMHLAESPEAVESLKARYGLAEAELLEQILILNLITQVMVLVDIKRITGGV
jgi:hypothetical protein